MRPDAAPQRAFGGDLYRVGDDPERRDAEPVEMRPPRRPISEIPLGMLGQEADRRPGQRPPAHIGERLGIDRVVAVTGTQKLKKVEPALRTGGAEPGEAV